MNYQNIVPNIEYIKNTVRNVPDLRDLCNELDEKLKYFNDIFPCNNCPISDPKLLRRNAITCVEDYYLSIIGDSLEFLRIKVQTLLEDYKRTQYIKQILQINNVDNIISNYLNDFSIKNNCDINILENIKIEI